LVLEEVAPVCLCLCLCLCLVTKEEECTVPGSRMPSRWHLNFSSLPFFVTCPIILLATCTPQSDRASHNPSGQVRSGMGACAGAAHHCGHFLPLLQRPPFSHLPDRCLAHPHLLEMPITRQVFGPFASSSHEAPSLRESGEHAQRQENEPHVHTAATNAHRLCR